jgi:hypothetical protein
MKKLLLLAATALALASASSASADDCFRRGQDGHCSVSSKVEKQTAKLNSYFATLTKAQLRNVSDRLYPRAKDCLNDYPDDTPMASTCALWAADAHCTFVGIGQTKETDADILALCRWYEGSNK